MAKDKKLFECQHCGQTSPKWLGKCTNCGGWDSFLEIKEKDLILIQPNSSKKKAQNITEIEIEQITKISTKEYEFDNVLGGGMVKGSLVLVGGSPGVGKSTLLLKISSNLAKDEKKVLYISAEESLTQIKQRAQRIDAINENLYLLSEIDLTTIKNEILEGNYEAIVIDSIQTIYSQELSSAPGSVSQVREITFELMRIAKDLNCTIFIIGHITKDGSIAGPRVLEHMVDTVLYFEGDSSREIRILRGFKNRFGSTSEIGVFEMTKDGLVSAKDLSSRFYSKNKSQSGSAATVTMEGSRPIVLEVQALVTHCGYGTPRRTTTGFESNRLSMLLALLEKKLDLPFNQYDVFVNIAGGIKISEPAADLAIIASIISSFKDRPISEKTVFLGEVSLIGDIRDVYNMEQRLKEAASLGFVNAIIPKKPLSLGNKIKCFEIQEVSKLLDWM